MFNLLLININQLDKFNMLKEQDLEVKESYLKIKNKIFLKIYLK